eukprot:7350735-Prymnesium_polylepis.1
MCHVTRRSSGIRPTRAPSPCPRHAPRASRSARRAAGAGSVEGALRAEVTRRPQPQVAHVSARDEGYWIDG